MQVLVPLATMSSLFNREDYFFSKPLIEVASRPMIERVIENLKQIKGIEKMLFVVTDDDVKKFSLDKIIQHSAYTIPTGIIITKHETQGALCSCLLAVDHIDMQKSLIISNGDQVFDVSLEEAISEFTKQNADAGVVTFDSVHPRWSYVKLDSDGQPCQFSEKDVVSRNAIAGVYYFKTGEEFVSAAFDAIRNEYTRNEKYFIAPCLNKFILEGKKICTYEIDADQYHSFYSPQKIKEYENNAVTKSIKKSKQQLPINIVIPAAGLGSRFTQAGYPLPKPFINVNGKTMIERVMDNLQLKQESIFHIILQSRHVEQYPEYVNRLKMRGAHIVEIDGVTEGTVCTVLSLVEKINNENPMLIANSDQVVNHDMSAYIEDALTRNLDGSILCFEEPSCDPKWSYIRANEQGFILEVKEKVAISAIATVGLYYFAQGKDFVEGSAKMISANDRVNNEFYTCPVYNYLIRARKNIGYYLIEKQQMHGLGTPQDLEQFITTRVEEVLA